MKRPLPIHGRDEELRLLQEQLERAMAGSQQFVVLEGDPGIGKSALLQAFAHTRKRWRPWRPWRRGPRFLYLRAPEGERFEPVRHASLALSSRRVYEKLGGKRQATEIAHSSLVDWLGVIPVWGNLIAALVATFRALQRRRRAASPLSPDEAIDTLLQKARHQTLVLLLDELERADHVAIAKLEALICTADAGSRILMVGAFRPTPAGVQDPPIHAMLRRLPTQNETVMHRRLRPLDRDAVEGWLRSRFPGSQVPSSFVDWLQDATGGHPGSIEATLGHLQEKGAIRFREDRWEFDTAPERLDLPRIGDSFADLSAINPFIADVVRVASTLGEEFDSTSLAGLLGRDELAVEDQLALGVHFGLLQALGERVQPDGEVSSLYRFASPHLRAALRHADLPFPTTAVLSITPIEARAPVPASAAVIPPPLA